MCPNPRNAGLPSEIKAWRQRTVNELDMNAHYSQLEAIATLMAEFGKRQDALLDNIDPGEDAEAFRMSALDLIYARF
jgi:hypothetical protein